jgi:hypothetical protein
MTPRDLEPLRHRFFMAAMILQCTFEHLRALRLYPEKAKGLNLVCFVRRTPPFRSPCPGTLVDVRNARCVPCPRSEALAEAVASILLDCGRELAHTFHCEPLRQEDPAADQLMKALIGHEYEPREALQEHETTLDRLLPPTRKRRLWKALQTIHETIEGLNQSFDYDPMDHPIPGGRRKFQAWQRELSWQLYHAFQRFGPAPTDFPEAAIDTAIAAMLIALELESGTVAQVAARVRKRIEKRLADESLIPDPGH